MNEYEECFECEHCVCGPDNCARTRMYKLEKENSELRASVGDLAVALSGALDIIGNVAEYIEADCGTMNSVETYRETLAKAREVCCA